MAKRHVSVPPVDLSWTPDVEVVLTWHNFTSEVVGSREGQLRTESRRELRPYVCACAHVRGRTGVRIGGGGSQGKGQSGQRPWAAARELGLSSPLLPLTSPPAALPGEEERGPQE